MHFQYKKNVKCHTGTQMNRFIRRNRFTKTSHIIGEHVTFPESENKFNSAVSTT